MTFILPLLSTLKLFAFIKNAERHVSPLTAGNVLRKVAGKAVDLDTVLLLTEVMLSQEEDLLVLYQEWLSNGHT